MATALTAAVQAAYGRVQLQLTYTTGTSATIYRVHADGTTWPVRGAAPATVLSTSTVGWVGYDHEAPLDQPITYRATDPTGATIATSASVTVASPTADIGSRAWLTHPIKPTLSQQILVTAVTARTRKSRGTVLQIVGSPNPVAVTDTRIAPTGELTVFTTTLAEAAALEALLADGQVLCLRAPAFWGSMWLYVLIGDTTDEAAAGHAADPAREWHLPYVAVAAPSGAPGGATGATWTDVLAAYATWTATIAGEPTWNDLMLKPGP